jgi:hypothetical protein
LTERSKYLAYATSWIRKLNVFPALLLYWKQIKAASVRCSAERFNRSRLCPPTGKSLAALTEKIVIEPKRTEYNDKSVHYSR